MPSQDIAIVGMSCRFPGAENYYEYWNNLIAGKCSVKEAPLSRWNWRDHQTLTESTATEFSRWAGFTEKPEYFDARFFGISPREAERMDPQQRLALEQAWHCIQDAGKDPRTLAGKNIGVFMAAGSFDYKELQELYSDAPEGHEATGVHNSVIANRISYFFNFNGPSVVVDTACSSSLVAMQQAVSAMQLGHCESALVGGVGLLLTPTTFIRFGKMGMLSPTGQCSAFDEGANGYVRGEGAGMVLLKPLAQAQADGDNIWGVIKSVAINHGGKARSLTSPSALAQAKLIVDAVQQADVPVRSINFIETHGTGTPLGDPIEIHGLSRAFSQLQKDSTGDKPAAACGLGAVKANIGHLECVAGMAGLIKILLSMKHKILPGHANFKAVNPRIKLADTAFHIIEKNQPWAPVLDSDGTEFPLRAGLSSFGFGGVNGHMIVEAVQSPEANFAVMEPGSPSLLTLSAESHKALLDLASAYTKQLTQSPDQWREVCASANQAQAGLSYRKAIFAKSAEEMVAKLAELQKQSSHSPISSERKIAFVFSGQGSQYPGMGAELYRQNLIFKQALDECDNLLRRLLQQSIIELMFDKNNSAIHLTQYTQPALFSLEYALAKMWQSLGIKPDIIIGHSIGELAGACVAGVLPLDAALAMVVKRGQLMGGVGVNGKMAAVFASEHQVKKFLQSINAHVDIAAINSPTGTVISGKAEAIDKAVNAFAAQHIDARYLDVSQAFHSSLMDSILEPFAQALQGIRFSTPKTKLVSNLTGKLEADAFCSADYWVKQIRNPVQYQAGIEILAQEGVTHLVEIGPSSMLISLAKRTLDQHQHKAILISSLKPEEPALTSLLSAAGQLFEAGFNPEFSSLTGSINPGAVKLPAYPFDRQAYWVAVDKPAAKRMAKQNAAVLPGQKIDLAIADIVCFEAEPVRDFGKYLLDHKVKGCSLMPAAGYMSCASAALAAAGIASDSLVMTEFKFLLPLHLDNTQQSLQTLLLRDSADPSRWNLRLAARTSTTEDWKLYATANFSSINPAPPSAMDSSLVEDFKLIPSVLQMDFYQQCTSKGLEYGPAFQAVTHVLESNGKVYGHLTLPENSGQLLQDCFAIHPSLLDGALQLVTLLASSTEGKIPLPISVERFSLYRQGDSQLYAIAELMDPENNLANISLYNPEGLLVAVIQGLHYRWLSAAQIIPAAVAAPKDFYFVPEWQQHQLPEAKLSTCQPLIIYECSGLPLLKELLARHPAAQHCPIGDLQALELCLNGSPQIDRIYFIAAAPQAKDFLLTHDNSSLIFLLELAQRLIAKGFARQAVTWLLISAASHKFATESANSLQGPALAGFVRSLCKEQSLWQARHIDVELDYSNPTQLIAPIEKIAASENSLEEYVLRQNQWWHRALIPAQTSSAVSAEAFRKGGVYLITGGAQGIGAALAKKLAKEQAAKLILLGRSERNAQHCEFEQQLNSLGGEAIYWQADVADYSSLRAVILQAVQKYGPIQGVIHSAGVIDDALLQNMTAAMLEKVCAPKIQGTINLYRAVNDQPLDFMLLFSSVMAWLAYAGQANYVAANAFVDGFTQAIAPRSPFPVKVINWGHWGETGMASSAYYRERIARLGIQEISTDEGLAAIESAIANQWSQLVVMKARENVLADMGVKNVTTQSVAAAETQISLPSMDQLQDIQSAATHDLLVASMASLIAQAMRMDVQELLKDKASFLQLRFTSLGIDSLTTLDLRKRIRDWLGVDVPADVLIGGALIGEVMDLLKRQILLQRLSHTNPASDLASENSSEEEEVFVI